MDSAGRIYPNWLISYYTSIRYFSFREVCLGKLMIDMVKYSVNRPALQKVGQCGIEQTRHFKEIMVPESCGVMCYANTTVQDLILHFR
jgi:hypothetical protein